MEGIIYILTNPAMPGMIKIGKTNLSDVKLRMAQLHTTGVPLPFECEYAAKVKDIDMVEKALHTAFSPNRINPKREFFGIEPYQAIGIIKLLEIKNTTNDVEQEPNLIDPIELEAGKEFARKRPKLNFEEMGIPVGSELVFINSGETATVIDSKLVRFRDEETKSHKCDPSGDGPIKFL